MRSRKNRGFFLCMAMMALAIEEALEPPFAITFLPYTINLKALRK